MRIASLLFLILCVLSPVSAYAVEETAPPPPESAAEYMPEDTESFADGIWQIVRDAVKNLAPSVAEAGKVCIMLITAVFCLSIVQNLTDKTPAILDLVGSVVIASALLYSSNSMISLAISTIREISDYGKLLIPVLSGTLAFQGASTTSASLYTGTVIFDSILSKTIYSLLTPLIYVYICLAIASSAVGENILTKLRDFCKWCVTWALKIILYVFTGYMTITGVVSGSTDASVMKATKITISGAVPVVGGILADASESVLVSAGLIKNSIGIYGLLVIGAIWIEPFLKIGVHYLLLKLTVGICEVFGTKSAVTLIKNFTTAMGLLLAMTGAVCLMLLISVVCFMKGVSL